MDLMKLTGAEISEILERKKEVIEPAADNLFDEDGTATSVGSTFIDALADNMQTLALQTWPTDVPLVGGKIGDRAKQYLADTEFIPYSRVCFVPGSGLYEKFIKRYDVFRFGLTTDDEAAFLAYIKFERKSSVCNAQVRDYIQANYKAEIKANKSYKTAFNLFAKEISTFALLNLFKAQLEEDHKKFLSRQNKNPAKILSHLPKKPIGFALKTAPTGPVNEDVPNFAGISDYDNALEALNKNNESKLLFNVFLRYYNYCEFESDGSLDTNSEETREIIYTIENNFTTADDATRTRVLLFTESYFPLPYQRDFMADNFAAFKPFRDAQLINGDLFDSLVGFDKEGDYTQKAIGAFLKDFEPNLNVMKESERQTYIYLVTNYYSNIRFSSKFVTTHHKNNFGEWNSPNDDISPVDIDEDDVDMDEKYETKLTALIERAAMLTRMTSKKYLHMGDPRNKLTSDLIEKTLRECVKSDRSMLKAKIDSIFLEKGKNVKYTDEFKRTFQNLFTVA